MGLGSLHTERLCSVQVCRDWENIASKAKTRVVILRTGIVLAKV
jgi:NAD dependent epimerase/dehydratase family enzyme